MAGEADRLTMYDPVACEIRVRGVLGPHWSDRLGGLEITVCDHPRAGDAATTELRGELLDQAALMGVLMTLYDLRLPLLSVACAPAGLGDAKSPSLRRRLARTHGARCRGHHDG